MNNLLYYDRLRSVPNEAKKTIAGGRLKGKTDINPMWRIKALTEAFGPCGFGWRYEITSAEMVPGCENQTAAFVNINLYVKVDGEWSAAIPGTGGSMFVDKEKGGLYTSDECYKMALTDAISVACKALGVGADVYWEADRSKYSAPPATPEKPAEVPLCSDCGGTIKGQRRKDGSIWSAAEIAEYTTRKYGAPVCAKCGKAREAAEQ